MVDRIDGVTHQPRDNSNRSGAEKVTLEMTRDEALFVATALAFARDQDDHALMQNMLCFQILGNNFEERNATAKALVSKFVTAGGAIEVDPMLPPNSGGPVS